MATLIASLLCTCILVSVHSQKETTDCPDWNECKRHIIDTNEVFCTSFEACLNAQKISSKGAKGIVECSGSESCNEAEEITVSDGKIICSGYKSCYSVYPTESDSIQCSGSHSCYCLTKGKTANLLGNGEISCGGYKSCENCKISAGRNVACDAADSCRNSDISSEEDVQCRGRQSCASSTVTTTAEVDCTGDAACTKTKIKSKKTTVKGLKSAQDASITSEIVEATGFLAIDGAEISSNGVSGDKMNITLAGEAASKDTTVLCVQGIECGVICIDECPELEVIALNEASLSVTITTSVEETVINQTVIVVTTVTCVTTDTNAGCPTMMVSNDNCTDAVLQKYLVEKRRKIALKRLSEQATGFYKGAQDEYDWEFTNKDEEYAIMPVQTRSKSILHSEIDVCVYGRSCQGWDLTQGEIQCYGFESCESANINAIIATPPGVSFTRVGEIKCYGDSSCKNAHIYTDRGSIFCYGSESCQFATTLQGKQIQCAGRHSCAAVENTVQSVSINCEGRASCENNVMHLDDTANCIARLACNHTTIYAEKKLNCDGISACEDSYLETKTMVCSSQESCSKSDIIAHTKLMIDGEKGCAHAHISHTPYIIAVGDHSLAYATIDTDGILMIKLTGNNAGFGANITCRPDSECKIECKSNGCKQLTIICETGATCATKPKACFPKGRKPAPKSFKGHICPTIIKRDPSDMFYSESFVSHLKSIGSQSSQTGSLVYYVSYGVFIIVALGFMIYYCDIFTYIKDRNNEKYYALHS